MPVFFRDELDCVATFWRIFRVDGVTLGFTSHDAALKFDGLCHLAAPGLMPTAIRRTTDLESDSAEVRGALSHSSISDRDLTAGLYDNAAIAIGAVNWETLERQVFYTGEIGTLEDDGTAFGAELLSAKSWLDNDLVPRTSPTCRAAFCGAQCGLSRAKFTIRKAVLDIDLDRNSVSFDVSNPNNFINGEIRFIDGAQTGIRFGVMGMSGEHLILDRPIHPESVNTTFAVLREGCDHTINTCTSRFDNAANFRGEPFLPGNDLLARYPIGP